ncbi:hypothetical protein BTE28158_01598 [Burkholderia territorii]|nr:hypothetical protein BTE28158_01598 [Burkholderia territorii]
MLLQAAPSVRSQELEGLRLGGIRLAHVVNVPFRFVRLLEAVPLIEAVRFAASQCTQANGHPLRIGICTDLSQHCCPDTLSLMFRLDVQVVQVQMVFLRANQHKAYTDTIGLDEATECRIKRREETLSCPLRVEATDTFQALAHRGNSNGHQTFGVRPGGGSESQVHWAAGHVVHVGCQSIAASLSTGRSAGQYMCKEPCGQCDRSPIQLNRKHTHRGQLSMSMAITITDPAISTTASHPNTFDASPLPGRPAASRRCDNSITSTSIGTAATPLSTALQ